VHLASECLKNIKQKFLEQSETVKKLEKSIEDLKESRRSSRVLYDEIGSSMRRFVERRPQSTFNQ
jgi:hypothetical protein